MSSQSPSPATVFAETAAHLQLAAELLNVVTWRHDLTTQRLYYNDRGWELLGLAPRSEGLSVAEVRRRVHPDDLDSVVASARRALHSDRPIDLQARYFRADGTCRHVLTRCLAQRGTDGRAKSFLGVALDITDQVEEAQRSSELSRRLELTAAAANIGIWVLHPRTGAVEWNEKTAQIYGVPADQPMTVMQWWDERVHPDDRERVRRHGKESLRSANPIAENELRVVRPDGEVRWVLIRGHRVDSGGEPLVYGVTIDVTERHRTEAALREANERAALAVRGAGMGTWEQDLETLTVYWDEQMFRLRGLEPEGARAPIGRGRELVHPDDRERVLEAWQAATRSGEPVSYEFRVRWPDGNYRWLASRLAPVKNEHGVVVRQIGVNWDITEHKTAEAQRHERALAQRESLAKSQFLARMSHELRTPLNAVLGFTQLLQVETDAASLQPAQRSKLEHVRNAGEHLLSLITDVLDLSNLEAGGMKLQMEPVPLVQAVSEALPLVEPLARKYHVALVPQTLSGQVMADPTRLRQVLLNLLTNAVKYNRPNGEVRIDSHADASGVSLRIVDTGRGMTDEQLAHLFEPFNRLGREHSGIEGTGIGLAIVKALVERMGGSIVVASRAEEGTVFTLTLPAAASAAPANAPPAAAETTFAELRALGRRRPRSRILYIEDNPLNVMLVEALVAQRPALGLESEPTGALGVEHARRWLPDLVLIDMQLPDFDGFEVLRRLRDDALTAQTPCIALSANAMPEDIARALEAGFVAYWTKPVDVHAFLAALDALFGRDANSS